MDEIKNGFINGLSKEQIKVYSNPKFDDLQMEQIRLGFENGLTIKQVEMYAIPEFGYEEMSRIQEEIIMHNTEHYKGELGEFDYSKKDFTLMKNIDGKDILHYNDNIGSHTLNIPKGITNTRGMFMNCTLPEDFQFGNFNTSEVTDMQEMFLGCSIPDGFTLGKDFNTCNVDNMNSMFAQCSMPDNFTLTDNFNTSNVKDMSFMFSNCELPDKFALGNNFDTSKVEDMSGMFSACSIAKEFSLGNKFVINDNCYTDYMFETSNRDLIDFSSELNLNNFSQLEEADLDLDEEEI